MITVEVDLRLVAGVLIGFLLCLGLFSLMRGMFTSRIIGVPTPVETETEHGGGCLSFLIITAMIAFAIWLLSSTQPIP